MFIYNQCDMWIVITNSLDNTVRRLNRQTLNHCFTNTHYLAFRIPMPKTHLPRNKISPGSHRILRKKSRPKSKVNETGWKMNERKKAWRCTRQDGGMHAQFLHPESRHLALNIHLMSYLNPPAVSAFYQSYCYYQ